MHKACTQAMGEKKVGPVFKSPTQNVFLHMTLTYRFNASAGLLNPKYNNKKEPRVIQLLCCYFVSVRERIIRLLIIPFITAVYSVKAGVNPSHYFL